MTDGDPGEAQVGRLAHDLDGLVEDGRGRSVGGAPEGREVETDPHGRILLDAMDLAALMKPRSIAVVGVARLAEAHREWLRAFDVNSLLVLDAGRGVMAVDWLIEFAERR